MAMAAAALAKVVRGGSSAVASRTLLPAILGSTPAAPAAGVGRLMHTGLSRTPGAGVRPHEQLTRPKQFSSKRFMSSEHPLDGGRLPGTASYKALGASGGALIISMLIYKMKI